jgi:lipoprotein-releasing system ATP-binding protein
VKNDDFLLLEKVDKQFENGRESLDVLKGIDLRVAEATSIVVTGGSGSGKSTLLNLIAGLDGPSSGSIRVGDYLVSESTEAELTRYRRACLGLIFQFHYLLREFDALENVMIPALISGRPPREARREAGRLLEEVGLAERKSHFPVQLSGGERQRVAVARALVNSPPLILADEPTGNLDEQNAALVAGLLFSLVKKHGVTLVLVTHDPGLAAMGDQRYKLHGGSLSRL